MKYPDAKFEILEDNIPREDLLVREKEEIKNHLNFNLVNKYGIK
jgi:hypothetical protein